MTGYQPKIEKTCRTCAHVGRSPNKDVCLDCDAEAGDDNMYPEWTPKRPAPPTGGSSGTSPHDEIARLKRREADLLEANNRYLERARCAEKLVNDHFLDLDKWLAKIGAGIIGHQAEAAAFIDNALDWFVRYRDEVADLSRKLADADAATIAMEAKVVDLEQTIARAHAILVQAPGLERRGNLAGLCNAVLRTYAELGGDAGTKRGG